jgi:hypothetical protein
MDNDEIFKLAEKLAEFYRGDEKEANECACRGLSCSNLGCFFWWNLFLRQISKEDIKKMLHQYLENKTDGR